MERYWKQGFYDNKVEGGVEITEQYYHELLEGQAAGQVIVEDGDGFPTLQPPAEPTREQLDKLRIAELRGYLTATDWCVVKCLERGIAMQDVYSEVYAKRESARAEINELETLILTLNP